MGNPKTYPQYMKAYGREEGRKKWREHKKKLVQGKELEPLANVIMQDTPKVYKEEEAMVIMLERGSCIADMIQTPGWRNFLEPRIKKDYSDYIKKALNNSSMRDEAMGAANYAQRLLHTIRKWINDYKAAEVILKEKAKERKIANRI